MKQIFKKAVAVLITVTMIQVGWLVSGTQTLAADPIAVKLILDESPFNDGRFQGWGTALCWWANRLGYSPQMTQQSADLFFSKEGLGLSIARYNIGGGDNPAHTHITRSDSKVPGYATNTTWTTGGTLTYDWTRDQNQRNIALAALKANPDLIITGFSNSPPYFMTVSGCSTGAARAQDNNLNANRFDDFAEYIAECTKHFRDEFGIAFQSYSPMNESESSYWGANSNKQEGCHFDPGTHQSGMITALRAKLDSKGLEDVFIVGTDETNPEVGIRCLDALTPAARDLIGRIEVHTYSRIQREQMKAKAVSLNKNLWMDECDNGDTVSGAGNMAAGLALAQHILSDMNAMQPSAWVLWDIIDRHRDANFSSERNNTTSQTSGLWGVGMGNHDTQNIELTQKYYVYGQFTRYFVPGDTIIMTSDSNSMAAYNKDSGDIKIITINPTNSVVSKEYDMSVFEQSGDSARVIRTMGNFNGGEHWADKGVADIVGQKFTYDLPAYSVTTFVIENDLGVNDIVSFNLGGYKGVIDKAVGAVSVTVPEALDVRDITPTITVSPEATYSPQGPRDFTNPVTYTILSSDNEAKTYTVTVYRGSYANFNMYGGSINGDTSDIVELVRNGGFTKAPSETPYRVGYTFVGWNTDRTATTAQAVDTVAITQNTVFYAIWQKDAWIDVVATADAGLKTWQSEKNTNYGTAANMLMRAPSNTNTNGQFGQNFTSTSTTDGTDIKTALVRFDISQYKNLALNSVQLRLAYQGNENGTATANITFSAARANWTTAENSVNWGNWNKTIYTPVVASSQMASSSAIGTAINFSVTNIYNALPVADNVISFAITVSHSGADFRVYSKEGAGTNLALAPTLRLGIVPQPDYMVTYDLNGGSGVAPIQPTLEGGKTFTAAGWMGLSGPDSKLFEEWNTKPDGTGTGYPVGATVTMPTENLTLYAIWSTEKGKIDGFSVADNKVTAISIRIVDPADAILLIAAYDASGRMIAISEYKPSLEGGVVQDIDVDFDIGGATLVKAFLWNNEYIPYTAQRELFKK